MVRLGFLYGIGLDARRMVHERHLVIYETAMNIILSYLLLFGMIAIFIYFWNRIF